MVLSSGGQELVAGGVSEMLLDGGRRLEELLRRGLPMSPMHRSSRATWPALWLLPFAGSGVHPQPW